MREVVGSNGETELCVVGVVARVVAVGVTDGSDFALRRECEDVVCSGEEQFAEVACCAGFFAEMVVADEEEGSFAVVNGVSNDAGDFCCDVDAAVWHEVVDVVDDDELWLFLFDKALDGSVDVPNITPLPAEDVKADVV